MYYFIYPLHNYIQRPERSTIKDQKAVSNTTQTDNRLLKMRHLFNFILPLLVLNAVSSQLDSPSPSPSPSPPRLSPVVIAGEGEGVCPSKLVLAERQEEVREEIEVMLNSTFTSPCPCAVPGQWTRIAHLNMSDPSQQCPSNWNLITTPVRGCRSSIATGPSCDSAMFPSGGQQYSRVCGRVNGYQQRNTDAFLC